MSGETLLERTQRAITTGHLLDPGDTVVVAVSGGADSVALLAALALLAAPLGVTLHVAHLDHGLRPDSADDAAFVADLARGHSLPVTIAVADVAGYADEHGLSLEEAGRAARYAFLGALAATLGARRIATAHHADDQAETVLARLLRGAGVDGLGGMRPLAALPPTAAVPFTVRYTDLDRLIEATPLSVDARVIRPLLGLRRHELRGYAAARGLAFRDDPTNQDTTLLRNYLRHEILPLLATVNPAIVETLARTATLMADDADVLHALTEAVWSDVARATTRREACNVQRELSCAWRVSRLTFYASPCLTFIPLRSDDSRTPNCGARRAVQPLIVPRYGVFQRFDMGEDGGAGERGSNLRL